MVKVGLIGLGNWGQKVLPKLNQVCEVVSCSNRGNLNAEKWLLRNYPNISHTFDYSEILDNGHIEAVVITTPIETHCEIVNDCLDAGKHVFVEKPLATNSSDVKKLFQKAKKNKLNLFVGYIYIYNKITQALIKINSSFPFSSLHMKWEKYGSFNEDIYWNLLSHELSILYKLFGSNLKEIHLIDEIGEVSTADKVHLSLLFANELNCDVKIDRASNSRFKNVRFLTDSGEVYEWNEDSLYQIDSEGNKSEVCKNNDDTLKIEIELFVNSINSGSFIYEDEMNRFISETISKIKSVNQRY